MPNPAPSSDSLTTAMLGAGNDNDGKIRFGITRWLEIIGVVSIMLALKAHYSLATADQLKWILAPTATLLVWLTPAHPVRENGVGYVDFHHGIIVAPGCAGINFMIMAFGLISLCKLVRMQRSPLGPTWLIFAGGAAYGYTILVNTARIGVSMILYQANLYSGWVTPERVHRLAGVGLYLGALWLLFTGVRILTRYRYSGTCDKRKKLPQWLPFVWYALGAVGVPTANLLFRQRSPSYGEHVATLLATVLCLWAFSTALRKIFDRYRLGSPALPSAGPVAPER